MQPSRRSIHSRRKCPRGGWLVTRLSDASESQDCVTVDLWRLTSLGHSVSLTSQPSTSVGWRGHLRVYSSAITLPQSH